MTEVSHRARRRDRRESRFGWAAALLVGLMAGAVSHGAVLEEGQDAVILEESLEIEILSPANARVRYLNRTKLLTPRGVEDHAVASVFYYPGVKILDLRGSVTLPSAKTTKVKKQDIVDGPALASFELYSDSRHRTVHFPGVVPGAVVEHSYELDVKNLHYMIDTFYLRETIPVRRKTLTVKAPTSFPLRISVRGSSHEPSREEHDGMVTHRWDVHDVPALKIDPNAPPLYDVLPRVSLEPESFLWGDYEIDAGSWDGIARFYLTLAEDRLEPATEVARTARELTAGAGDPEEMIRRVYEFVQKKVNYVSVSLDIGGWQPHHNGDVLRHMYGDCKDKATLMIAMLRAVGLDGHPVLIRTRNAGLLNPDLPSLSFNHAIVALPIEDGYMFLDPTSEETPFGDLPWQDQGASALVVKAGGHGDFVLTPLSPPERNRRHVLITGSIDLEGNLEGALTIKTWGQRRAGLSSLLTAKPSEREDAVAWLTGTLASGAEMRSSEVLAPEDPDAPLVLTARFALPRFMMRAGPIEIVSPHLVRFTELTPTVAYPERSQPVFLAYPFTETVETRLELPIGRTVKKIPAGREIQEHGLEASTSYTLEREGEINVLVVSRSISVGHREMPAGEYAALRSFVAALTKEEAEAVTLRPES